MDRQGQSRVLFVLPRSGKTP